MLTLLSIQAMCHGPAFILWSHLAAREARRYGLSLSCSQPDQILPPPLGDTWQGPETFLVTSGWVVVGKGQGRCQMSYQAQDSPQHERIPQPNTGNSAEVKKPSLDWAASAWGSYYEMKVGSSNMGGKQQRCYGYRHRGSHV